MAAALKVFIITGEPSGDTLAEACIAPLRRMLAPRDVQFCGVGGERLSALGLNSLFPQDDIAVMGVAAVVQRLPLLVRRIRQTADAIIAEQPDLVLTIDSPDFCFRVTRDVRKRAPHIPIVHWVCPSVWAWRPGRAAKMKAHVDKVLCLLPFEPHELAVLKGPPGVYVGHPLIAQLGQLRPQSQSDVLARETGTSPNVLLLPGSRRSEVSRLMTVFGEAAALIRDQVPRARFVLPVVPGVRDEVETAVARWRVEVELVDSTAKLAAFRQARAALAASGTVGCAHRRGLPGGGLGGDDCAPLGPCAQRDLAKPGPRRKDRAGIPARGVYSASTVSGHARSLEGRCGAPGAACCI
jgi:lipid-A-disaccharide synthase